VAIGRNSGGCAWFVRLVVDVFGERHFVDQNVALGVSDDAGHGSVLRETLLFHEQFERTITTPAGGNFECAGFRALGVEDCADMQALDQSAPGDRRGEFFDRNAGLHAPNIRLRQDELVERDVAGG
jgi:hypothetical protein